MVATRTVTTTDQVKGLLKAELKRRGLTYADLARLLAERGKAESEANLRNKISRGSFTAAFLFECLIAMGCEHVSLGGPAPAAPSSEPEQPRKSPAA